MEKLKKVLGKALDVFCWVFTVIGTVLTILWFIDKLKS